MIFTSNYLQKLNISRVKILSELFSRSIKINKCNSNERDEENNDIKNKIKNDYSNKDLFKFIRAFKDLMLEFFVI